MGGKKGGCRFAHDDQTIAKATEQEKQSARDFINSEKGKGFAAKAKSGGKPKKPKGKGKGKQK